MYRPQTKAPLVIDLKRYFAQSVSTFARLTEYNHDWPLTGVLKTKKPGSIASSRLYVVLSFRIYRAPKCRQILLFAVDQRYDEGLFS